MSLLGHQTETDNCKKADLNPTTHTQAHDSLTYIYHIGLRLLTASQQQNFCALILNKIIGRNKISIVTY